MALGNLKRFIKQDVALDLGTANTLIFLQGEGIVLNTPSVVALDQDHNVISFGGEARRFLGRNPPGINVVRPLKHGVIEDFDAAALFLQSVVDAARRVKPVFSSRIVLCVPSQLTQVEKRSLLEAARGAGFSRISLLEEVMAAAIGAGVNVAQKEPSMVVDIGGGTTEVAVIAEMAYLFCRSRRIAGDEMDKAIAHFMLERHGLRIGPITSERVKWEIGSTAASYETFGSTMEVAGQDVEEKIPSYRIVTGQEIQEALADTVDHVIASVTDCISALPPGLIESIEKSCILLTGGGSLLRGFPDLLEKRTGIKVCQPKSPLTSVVEGAGKTLSNFEFYSPAFAN